MSEYIWHAGSKTVEEEGNRKSMQARMKYIRFQPKATDKNGTSNDVAFQFVYPYKCDMNATTFDVSFLLVDLDLFFSP